MCSALGSYFTSQKLASGPTAISFSFHVVKADLYLENKGAKIWTPYFVIGSLLEAKNGFMSSNLMTLPQTNKPSSAGVEPQCPDEDGGSGITGSFESLLPPPGNGEG